LPVGKTHGDPTYRSKGKNAGECLPDPPTFPRKKQGFRYPEPGDRRKNRRENEKKPKSKKVRLGTGQTPFVSR